MGSYTLKLRRHTVDVLVAFYAMTKEKMYSGRRSGFCVKKLERDAHNVLRHQVRHQIIKLSKDFMFRLENPRDDPRPREIKERM